MNTDLLVRTAKVTKTPSDGKGTFEFTIEAFDTVDADNEIIENYINVGDNVAVIPVAYGHLDLIGPGADPLGQKIGSANVTRESNKLLGAAKLDLSNRVASMVHERLLLPSDDPDYLGEVSVFFAYDLSKATVEDGVKTIRDAELISVAVVREGAQSTSIQAVKALLRKNVYTFLPGSEEEARRDIDIEVQAWAQTAYPPSPDDGWTTWASIAGTFPDRVVVEVSQRDTDTLFFSIPYTRTGDTVTLGTPEPVTIEATVTPSKNASNQSGGSFGAKVEIDEGDWDGDAALASASTAAEFKQIAFERDNDSDPDTAAHYALPHHSSPGAPPNVKGVGAAAGALAGARGQTVGDLKDRDSAAAHIKNHQDEIEAEQAASKAAGAKQNAPLVDETDWDGPAALAAAGASADPVAALQAITAGAREGFETDQANPAWYFGPHHTNSGDPANVRGVTDALAAIAGLQVADDDLVDRYAANAHLQEHYATIIASQDQINQKAASPEMKAVAEYAAKLDELTADLVAPGTEPPAPVVTPAKVLADELTAKDVERAAIAEYARTLTELTAGLEPVSGKAKEPSFEDQLDELIKTVQEPVVPVPDPDPEPEPEAVDEQVIGYKAQLDVLMADLLPAPEPKDGE